MSELDLIRFFRKYPQGHPWLKVGPGHDCAILKWDADRDLAFKIDQIVEDTHFVLAGPEAASPMEVGWKAVAKALSDIAAAGAEPVAATVAVHLRKGLGDAWARELHGGIAACCEGYGLALAGGDITSGNGPASVCVSMIGQCTKDGAWTRGGAMPGDVLVLTGQIGGSRGAAKKHLIFEPRIKEARAIREAVGAGVHACIDVTDGLSRDAGHLCAESGCGVEIDEAALPIHPDALAMEKAGQGEALEHALGDGEDFELLLAIEHAAADRLLAGWKLATPLTRIGRVTKASSGRTLKRKAGAIEALPDRGYEHGT
ncbi:MAG: thiamine-phosphate kinase [Planctomycetes bacterium]|nr:thiamine-phosphate kinase [Planctomycetota bacterium]